jgi:hypothetical protein
MKKEIIVIRDEVKTQWFLPAFIRRLFIKNYYTQGGVYINKNYLEEHPTYCSDTIRWLDSLQIETFSQKRADELSWSFFHEKYPQYGRYIQLF